MAATARSLGTRRNSQVIACLLLLTFGVGVWIVFARPLKSPRAKALRLGGECGLGAAEIDGLIDSYRHTTLTPAVNLALLREQFERPADADSLRGLCCRCPCAGRLDMSDPIRVGSRQGRSSHRPVTMLQLWLSAKTKPAKQSGDSTTVLRIRSPRALSANRAPRASKRRTSAIARSQHALSGDTH